MRPAPTWFAALPSRTTRWAPALASRWRLAFLRSGGYMPVLGARSTDQIRDNLAAVDVRLDDDQLARLEAATHVNPGYPHEFLAGDHRRAMCSRAAFDE